MSATAFFAAIVGLAVAPWLIIWAVLAHWEHME